MANEITLNVLLQAIKAGATVSGAVSQSLSMTGNNFIGNVQSIGTADENLVLGDVTNPPQYVLIINQDTTNFVQIDANSSYNGFPQKILPGGCILLCPETATIHAKADTAAVNVLVVAVDF